MPGSASTAAAAIAERADAGQHHPVGIRNDRGARGDEHIDVEALFAGGALEGLGGGAEVAGAVIDDGDVHAASGAVFDGGAGDAVFEK